MESILQSDTMYVSEEKLKADKAVLKAAQEDSRGWRPKNSEANSAKDLSQLSNTRLCWSEVYNIIQVHWS